MSLSEKEFIQINQALFTLTHAYESRMAGDPEVRIRALSLADCSVIMVLGQAGPTTARTISNLMDINPGTISVYVQRLTEKGMVERRQLPDDRRNWELRLTGDGKQTYQFIIRQTIAYTIDFLSVLDEREKRELHRLLLKASHSLGFTWQ